MQHAAYNRAPEPREIFFQAPSKWQPTQRPSIRDPKCGSIWCDASATKARRRRGGYCTCPRPRSEQALYTYDQHGLYRHVSCSSKLLTAHICSWTYLIVVCNNPTEEPLHWLAVAELHSTYYHPPHPELFVIPEPTIQPTPAPSKPVAKDHDPNQASTSKIQLPDPMSPSKSSIASSAPSTPSSVARSSDRGHMVSQVYLT